MPSSRSSVLRSFAFVAVLGACALSASHARAGFALRVLPIPITITGGATSTMVELGNEGQEPLRVQANAVDWTQAPNGDDATKPSAEVLVFPSLVTIPPGGSRKVRVGTQGGYGAAEKSFRVIFAEVPPNSTPTNGVGETVNIVSHVSIPVFVTPPGAKPTIQIDSVTSTKDHVKVNVRNTGNAHAMVSWIRIEAIGEGGKPLGKSETAGWYVLPSLVRPFDVDVSKLCPGAKQLVVSAVLQGGASTTSSIDHPACGQP